MIGTSEILRPRQQQVIVHFNALRSWRRLTFLTRELAQRQFGSVGRQEGDFVIECEHSNRFEGFTQARDAIR